MLQSRILGHLSDFTDHGHLFDLFRFYCLIPNQDNLLLKAGKTPAFFFYILAYLPRSDPAYPVILHLTHTVRLRLRSTRYAGLLICVLTYFETKTLNRMCRIVFPAGLKRNSHAPINKKARSCFQDRAFCFHKA